MARANRKWWTKRARSEVQTWLNARVSFAVPSGPLTGEHVIPVWLQEYIGGKEKGRFRGIHANLIGMVSERTASANSHTLGTVCATCNNGWMSRLETDFQTLLPRLRADLSPNSFSKAERRTIALWIVKTGIVAHRSANYRTILPASVPLAISQGAALPAGVKVFGGNIKSGKTIKWVQSNIGVARVRQTDVSRFDAFKDTFVFALSIIDIFVGFGWHRLPQNEFEIFYTGNSVQQIYPCPKAANVPCVFEDLNITTTEIGLRRKNV